MKNLQLGPEDKEWIEHAVNNFVPVCEERDALKKSAFDAASRECDMNHIVDKLTEERVGKLRDLWRALRARASK